MRAVLWKVLCLVVVTMVVNLVMILTVVKVVHSTCTVHQEVAQLLQNEVG